MGIHQRVALAQASYVFPRNKILMINVMLSICDNTVYSPKIFWTQGQNHVFCRLAVMYLIHNCSFGKIDFDFATSQSHYMSCKLPSISHENLTGFGLPFQHRFMPNLQ